MRSDFRRVVYIGLDVAETMGVALVPKLNDATAFVGTIKGTPVEQLSLLMDSVLQALPPDSEPVFVIERLHHFQNKQTVRSLAERSGYLKHSLLAFGYQVREAGVSEARKSLGTKSKEETFMYFVPRYNGTMLTSDHTDALAIALYAKAKDVVKVNMFTLQIYGVKFEGDGKGIKDEHIQTW